MDRPANDWLPAIQELSAQRSKFRNKNIEDVDQHRREREKKENETFLMEAYGTHLSRQVSQQHTRCMTLSTPSLPGPCTMRSEPSGVARAQASGVHECLPCIVLSGIVLNNVENQESQCEGPGAACKSISKFAPLWGGARGPGDTTEVKPRDHTRVSVRVDRDARVGRPWATDSEQLRSHAANSLWIITLPQLGTLTSHWIVVNRLGPPI